jgi:TM2 domain-containing membrane protein YozV
MVTDWYFAKNNERHGPVSLADVRRLLASGSLEPTDLVWAEHLPGWVAAKDVREIAAQDFLGSIPGLRQPAARTPPAMPTAPARRPAASGEAAGLPADLDAFPVPGRTIVIHHPPVRRWSPGLAAVLSFFLPGLGQVYKGQIVNGIVWFFVVGLGYMALILPGLLLHFCCVIGAASGNPWTEGKTTVVRE